MKGRVFNQKVNVIIDTGSSVTILASSVFSKIAQKDQPSLRTFPDKLFLADGSELPVLGVTTIPFKFGDLLVEHATVIADIESDGLIGLDFMKINSCEINYGEKTFVVNGHALKFTEQQGQLISCRITAAKTITIPPNSEFMIEGKVQKRSGLGQCSVVEPVMSIMQKHGLIPGRVVVNPSKGNVPICVANPSDEPIVLVKGTNIAVASPIVNVCALPNAGETVNQVQNKNGDDEISTDKPDLNVVLQGPLQKHLEDLLDRSKSELTNEQYAKTRNFLFHYAYVFSAGGNDIGRCDILKHQIPTGDNRPIKLPPRQIPIHLKGAVDKELDRLLDMGIIRPSASPWSSCIVVVRKSDGSIRICLDVRAVNARTKHDSFPLPRTDTCLQSMHGSNYFSTLDLYAGFNQILLDERDACKTSFSTERGSFEYVMLPFGLQGGPATCQRLMQTIMTGNELQKRLIIYMDDLICHAPSFDSALESLAEVAFRLLKANLKVKTTKCILFQKSVSFLGHRVSAEGVATCPEKISKVKEWPSPKNLTEVKGFLGLCSYYKSYIPDYGEIAFPLHRLSQKEVTFDWSAECEEAFEKLKSILCSSAILAFPNENDTFIVDTDASLHSIGAVLSQVQNGQERVIAYGSKVLSKQERNYCTTRRELLAIVHFVPKWRHFLLAKKFLLRSDHGSLHWLFNWRNPEGQIARWLEILGPFDFDIEHRSGKKHSNADGMSRIPCVQCGDGIESDENDRSEDLRTKARRIVETIKTQKKKTKLRVSDDKKIAKENEISVETNETVKPAVQAVTGDHNYAFPKPLSEESDHASNAQADLNSSRSSDSANAEPDDTPEDHWLSRLYEGGNRGNAEK